MKKKLSVEILLVWMFVPPIVLSVFRRGVLDQLFVGIVSGVILAMAILLAKTKRALLFIVIIAGINIFQVWKNFPTNTNIFFQAPQPEMRYSDQLKVIDEVYRRAGSKSFEIQAYTIPYFWQDAWTYLFWYRGNEKFGGKLPVEHGGEKMFVIIKKDRADRTFQENWYRDTVTTWGKLMGQVTIGEYTIEERLMYL